MDKNKITKRVMKINLEQMKLVSSPIRAKIIYLLDEKAMTAKQVADELGKTPGSVHYHIQQLYQGGILELTETRDNKGIIEKYYRSKANTFTLEDPNAPIKKEGQRQNRTFLTLTEEELIELEEEWNLIIKKFIERTMREDVKRQPYDVTLIIDKREEGEDDEIE